MSEPIVARSRAELEAARASLTGTVALVPTMGALHEGHHSLLRKAKRNADHTVVSIFVNPLQFAPTEDLDRYPRTFDADLQMCAAEDVAIVFAPTNDVMYPTPPVVRVCAGAMGERLEGASRPGHFDGVLTVVAKLFALTRPHKAVFGRKDAQQLALVRRMVADLDLGVEILSAPVVRDRDGLALSSRNKYLSDDQRDAALILPSALSTTAQALEQGASSAQALTIARALIASTDGVALDYVALVDPDTFDDVLDVERERRAILAAAARVGTTRLIDNVDVTLRAATPAPTPREV
ncbi:MAG TPA: pantoate--beta-alanine ligase [Acidothermaceae bacterium]|nr:pantoate--beta-alanine ligase [Acidothermaceae bacterium]